MSKEPKKRIQIHYEKMNKNPIQKSLFPIGTGSSLLSIAALSIENSSLTNC